MYKSMFCNVSLSTAAAMEAGSMHLPGIRVPFLLPLTPIQLLLLLKSLEVPTSNFKVDITPPENTS